jgi:hypothetical protein
VAILSGIQDYLLKRRKESADRREYMQNKLTPNAVPASNENSGQFAMAKKRLASHPETVAPVLQKLAEKSSPEVLERVAENPQTAANTLEQLSSHHSAEVRSAVTENRNTPSETLQQLAGDENPDVRYRLAENANTPVEILETLALDDNPFVLARANDTLEAAKSVSQRADEMLLQERFSEAEELYRRLAHGLEELLGPDHQEVASALHKLAAAVGGQSKVDDAATIEARACAIKDLHKATL